MPGKRSNGEGALRKRSSGLWECMIMTGFQPNGKREYKSFYARTRKEVLQKVKDYQAAVESGLDMTKKDLKFAEWSQTWYDGYKGRVSPTTYESYGYTLKTLNRAFGSKPLTFRIPFSSSRRSFTLCFFCSSTSAAFFVLSRANEGFISISAVPL